MSERLRPAATGGFPPKLEATIIEPQVKPGSGRGSGVRNPGTGTSFTPDRQPKPRKSHKVRNFVVAATATLGGGTAAFVATRGGNEASPNTTAVVTTVDIKPTSPSDPVTTTVGESTTTVHETTTTQEPKPTDVVKDMGEYKVLQNGGLLYETPHLVLGGQELDTSSLGGFEIHVASDGNTFGLLQNSEGLNAQETLLETVLWAFAYQDDRFVNPDNTVDIPKYLQFLADNNNVDPEVVFPRDPDSGADQTQVVPSSPISIDLKLPIVITNAGISSVESSQPKDFFFIHAIGNDDIQVAIGVTEEGQLVYSVNQINRNGQISPLKMFENELGSMLTVNFGGVMADIGNITRPASTPEEQLKGPYFQFLNPTMIEKVPEKFKIPDITKFLFLDPFTGANGDRIITKV